MQHTSRQLLIDQRTAVANSLRSQLAEFGVIERKGIENVGELVRMLDEDDEELAQIPAGALMVMKILADQLRAVDAHVSAIDEQIEAWQRESAAAQALKTIPGIGALVRPQRHSGRNSKEIRRRRRRRWLVRSEVMNSRRTADQAFRTPTGASSAWS